MGLEDVLRGVAGMGQAGMPLGAGGMGGYPHFNAMPYIRNPFVNQAFNAVKGFMSPEAATAAWAKKNPEAAEAYQQAKNKADQEIWAQQYPDAAKSLAAAQKPFGHKLLDLATSGPVSTVIGAAVLTVGLDLSQQGEPAWELIHQIGDFTALTSVAMIANADPNWSMALSVIPSLYGAYRGLNLITGGNVEAAMSNPFTATLGILAGGAAVFMGCKLLTDYNQTKKEAKKAQAQAEAQQDQSPIETASISRGEKPADTTSAFNESSKGDGKSGGNATTAAAAPVDVTPPKQPPKTPNSKLGQ
jgi:hypothetical protein